MLLVVLYKGQTYYNEDIKILYGDIIYLRNFNIKFNNYNYEKINILLVLFVVLFL